MSSPEQPEGSKATIKRLPNSSVEIAIPVPGQATQAAYDKVLFEVSKNVQIPGFRKGSRIPPAVLEQTMQGGKNALKVQAIQELLKKLVEPALKEQQLDAIGQPVLIGSAEELAVDFTPGQELTLAVKCDVWPEIQWKVVEGQEKPYTGLTGKYKRKPFNAVKLNQAVHDLKERYATLEPITDKAHALTTGDACVVNMMGYMATPDGNKGDPLPNAASGDRVDVILGPGRYMEGLVEGLEGAKVGETVTVKVNFPDVSTSIPYAMRGYYRIGNGGDGKFHLCFFRFQYSQCIVLCLSFFSSAPLSLSFPITFRNSATRPWQARRPSLTWKFWKPRRAWSPK
jgi:trigger factor